MTKIKFGTDGWRAIIGKDYTYDNVAKVIQAYCQKEKENSGGLLLLGYDRRFGSRLFAEHAASVLLGNGFDVLLSRDFCPTPCISWMVKNLGAIGGVVITASHNPFQWNGVKFKENYGGSASPEFCLEVEKHIEANTANKVVYGNLKDGLSSGQLKYFSPHEAYLEQLKDYVDLPKIKASKMKIVMDPMYGAGAGFLKALLGDQVQEIRFEENPSFGGINPEPIDKNLKALFSTVVSNGAYLGLATDGDADRIGASDERGQFVNSHQIFSLILRHLVRHKNKRGDVVKTVSTTAMVSNIAKSFDLPIHETPIGFKHICKKFLDTKPLMGGEESGGIGIADHVYERDGLLCALLLCEIVAIHGKKLSAIIEDLQKEFGPLYIHRHDIPLAREEIGKLKTAFETQAPESIAGKKVTRTNFMDGYKFFFEDESWVLIRPSGTEPLLRIYGETPSIQATEELLDSGLKLVQAISKK